MSRDLRRALYVALPVLGIAIGIARAELYGASAKRFVFDITGYDPRDLLQGHYLQYRLVFDQGAGEVCQNQDPDCAMCLKASAPDVPPHVTRFLRSQGLPACDATLSTVYLTDLQRFFIAEARADELTEKLRLAAEQNAARVVVAISPSGQARATALILNGEEVR